MRVPRIGKKMDLTHPLVRERRGTVTSSLLGSLMFHASSSSHLLTVFDNTSIAFDALSLSSSALRPNPFSLVRLNFMAMEGTPPAAACGGKEREADIKTGNKPCGSFGRCRRRRNHASHTVRSHAERLKIIQQGLVLKR